MKIKAVIYRLESTNGEIQNILDYNFFDYQDSSDLLFWRNVTAKDTTRGGSESKDNSSYTQFYKDELTRLKNLLKDEGDTKFQLREIDISDMITGYESSVILGRITNSTSIEFKSTAKINNIKENDLVIITEDDKIAFIGYIVDLTTKFAYGEFFISSATVGNIGWLYEKTKISVDKATADLVVAGLDYKVFDRTAFADIFNNKNALEIVNFILTNLFFAISTKERVISKEYGADVRKKLFAFDIVALNDLNTFNVVFTFLKVLQKWQEETGSIFTWAEIEHGEHNVYNVMWRSSYENYDATFTTPATIFEEVIKEAMYDIFMKYDGTLVIRPPLYNYLPFEMLVLNTNRDSDNKLSWFFNPDDKHFIKTDVTIDETLAFENSAVKSRTDARWMNKFVGIENFIPSYFIDVKALIKYGFTNETPYNNANALLNQQAATMLAAIINTTQNALTRNLTVTVKYADINKYNVGELYYLEKYNMVGYLIAINRSINVNAYPTATLIFSFLRVVQDTIVTDTNMNDIVNIYMRYGIYQNIDEASIDVNTFEIKKQAVIERFKAQIQFAQGVKVPAFKVFPTILDFIQITDGGQQTAITVTTKTAVQPDKENVITDVSAQVDTTDTFMYRSFAIKMEQFFELERKNDDAIVSTTSNKFLTYTNGALISGKGGILPNAKSVYEKTYLPRRNESAQVDHHGYLYSLYKSQSNINLWQMKTPLSRSRTGQISQKLLNRIVECDAELKLEFPFYNPTQKLANTIAKTTNSLFRANSLYFTRIKPLSNFTDLRYFDTGFTFQKNASGDKIISPQTIFNFEFAFNSENVFLGAAETFDSVKIEKETGPLQNLLNAHKEGRAIDIVLPQPGLESFLYFNKDYFILKDGIIQNTLVYTQDFIDDMTVIFKRHFDVVSTTISTLNGYKNDPLVAPLTYAAIIFHLEVKDTNYTDIEKELLNAGDASS